MKNKNVLSKILCSILSIGMIFSMASCKGNNNEKGVNAEKWEITDPTKETYVIKNGISPYKILIPEDASSSLLLAADEFQFFFEKITGVELEIVTKADNLQGKYFSIGNTTVMQTAGITNSYGELGMDGYRVKTYGDAVIMVGENDKSSTYAVYGYLAKQFGLEIYAEDIFRIYPTSEAKLIDVDWTDMPDIPVRNGGVASYSWYGSEKYMSRMRFRNMEEFWGLRGHTFFVVLPPDEYLEAHPDWYDDPVNPNEICKTNAEMVDQFVENLKQIILDTPDRNFFMLGHEDGGPMCKCENCQAVRDQYDGSNTALEVLFTNDVVRRINEWSATACPDRDLQFCIFAYTTTEAPPTTYDAATDTYSPIHNDQKLMLEDNLGVQIAPISNHVSLPYMDQSYSAAIFNGWAAVTNNFYIWGYCCPFGNYMTPFDCFGSYAENYRDYVEIGAVYVFDQGFGKYSHNFMQLRDYICSKLMWDTTLDTETLIQDFMKHYYGAGWEYIYEFYTLWRLRMTELQEFGMYSYCASQLVQDWCQPDLYPKELLDQYEALFDAALLANEALQETDPGMYERYRDNIRSERCLVRYLSISMYANYYDYDTYKAMIDEFSDISAIKGMQYYGQSGSQTIESLINTWTEKLNLK